LEFYQLEAFMMVVANKSFSRAAESLYLSQPTISAHVKSLEKELNVPLFDRGKNGLITTPAGDTLYRYARDLLDLRTTALAEISANNEVGEETLIVAASSVPCQYLLPRVTAAFQKKFPGVSISLRQENSRQACEDVHNYHCSLGVVGDIFPLPRLLFHPILQDELVVAIPNREEYSALIKKDSLNVDDLADYHLLLREPGSGTRSHFEEELQKAGHSLDTTAITVYDNQETIKQAVRQGLGLTVISRYVVEDYEEFGLLVTRPLEGLQMKRDFYLVCHDKRVLSPASKALLAFVQEFLAEEGHS
jgi:DNA-binding transcriptional LysR family regulator